LLSIRTTSSSRTLSLFILNQFFQNQTDQVSDTDIASPDPYIDFQFVPSETYLRVKREKLVSLRINSDKVRDDEVVLIESNNDKITVRPDSFTINKKKDEKKGILNYKVHLLCEELHESGTITALTEASDNNDYLKATLKIKDVKDIIGDIEPQQPDEMEFRPKKSVGLPNKSSTTMLFINLEKIPIGRKIKIQLKEVKGNIKLIDKHTEIDSLQITISNEHVISKNSIAKVPIYFMGTGKGQHAKVFASTHMLDGKKTQAIGKIEVGEIEAEKGGFFENSKYEYLDLNVAGTVSEHIIYINSKHPINQYVFGTSKEEFDENQLNNHEAQLRYAELLLDIAVFYTADIKEKQGGEKGLILRPNQLVQDVQRFIDEYKYELAPKVYKAIVRGF